MNAAKKWLILLLTAVVSFTSLVTAKTGPSHGKVVVCYISTWAVYRPGRGAYSIEDFDASLCTHAVYAFAGLDIEPYAIKSLDPWQDLKEEYGKGGYERLTALKRAYPHLKVNLAIGGWKEGSKNYSQLVAEPTQRRDFVKQVSNFIRKYKFDGLDLDWEYPTQRGGQPEDRENFVQLTMELREEFDRHNLMLTSAIGASKSVIDQAYNVRQLSRYLDFLHIMCYDYHGSWDKMVGYNSPLKAPHDDPLSVQYTIDYLLKLGAPREKLVLGLPFYGRTFDTVFEGNLGDKTDGTAMQGPYSREDGFLGYNEICSILSNKSLNWQTVWDGETSQMLARSPRDQLTSIVNVVTFDTPRAIANKVRFAVEKNLGGVMIWSVDTDDFHGDCELSTDTFADFNSIATTNRQFISSKYPLLNTINEAIILAQDEIRHRDEHDDQDISDNEIDTGGNRNGKKSKASLSSTISQCLLMILGIQSLNILFGQ